MAPGAHHRTAEGVGSDFSPSIARKDRSFDTKQPTQTGCTGAQAGAGCSAKELAPKGKELLDPDTELSEV